MLRSKARKAKYDCPEFSPQTGRRCSLWHGHEGAHVSESPDVWENVPEAERCQEETAGYDGMFGVYCNLRAGHAGPHNDGFVRWELVGDDTAEGECGG